MLQIKLTNIERWSWLFLSAIVFLYILLRAIYNPLLHDEIGTYFHYLQSGEYLPPIEGVSGDANNHLLNSFLAEVSYKLFGNSAFSLRLPNVFSFIIYAYAIAQIMRYVSNMLVRNVGFLALISVTYLIEYFGFCRGYGMSMAFLMFALVSLLKWLNTHQLSSLVLVNISLFLGCMANLTLINSYGLFQLVIVFTLFQSKQNLSRIQIIKAITVIGITAIIMFYPLFFSFDLKKNGALYYGSQDGLWDVTGKTITELLFFKSTHWLFALGYVLIFLFAGLLVLKLKKKNRFNFKEPLVLVFYFIALNVLGIIAMVYVLDVNFPSDRAAMYLILLGILLLIFSINEIKQSKYLVFILLYFPIHLVWNMNLMSSSFSPAERVSEELHTAGMNLGLKSATIGSYHTDFLCWNYYEQRTGRKIGFAHPTKENDTLYDLLLNKTVLVDSTLIYPLYTQIYKDQETGVVLFERKNKLQWKVKKQVSMPSTAINSEYLDLALDTIQAEKALKINVQFALNNGDDYFKGNIVLSGKDTAGKEVAYQYVNLDWLYGKTKESRVVNQNFVISTQGLSQVLIYLWNIDEEKIALIEPKITIFSVVE